MLKHPTQCNACVIFNIIVPPSGGFQFFTDWIDKLNLLTNLRSENNNRDIRRQCCYSRGRETVTSTGAVLQVTLFVSSLTIDHLVNYSLHHNKQTGTAERRFIPATNMPNSKTVTRQSSKRSQTVRKTTTTTRKSINKRRRISTWRVKVMMNSTWLRS